MVRRNAMFKETKLKEKALLMVLWSTNASKLGDYGTNKCDFVDEIQEKWIKTFSRKCFGWLQKTRVPTSWVYRQVIKNNFMVQLWNTIPPGHICSSSLIYKLVNVKVYKHKQDVNISSLSLSLLFLGWLWAKIVKPQQNELYHQIGLISAMITTSP